MIAKKLFQSEYLKQLLFISLIFLNASLWIVFLQIKRLHDFCKDIYCNIAPHLLIIHVQ